MISDASTIQLAGAFCFGAIIGWYVYIINRHHKDGMQLTHLIALIGVIGGGATMALFPVSTDLFGAYGVGLGAGFCWCFMFSLMRAV